MPLDPELRAMLVQTMYVARAVGNDLDGDNIYALPVAAACRCQPRKVVTDTSPTGEETTSDYRLITEYLVGERDHIWLPGVSPTNNDAAARVPQSVSIHYDEDGSISHYEVLV